MKRSNFLASIAAIFLAPFGIKAKPEYTLLKPNPDDVGNWIVTTSDPVKFTEEASFFVGDKEYKLPTPNDNKFHDFAVKYDRGNVQYFIDGKEVFIQQ